MLPAERPPYELSLLQGFRGIDWRVLWSAKKGVKLGRYSLPLERVIPNESRRISIMNDVENFDSDLVMTLETHSYESYMISKNSSVPHVVVVWETVKTHPYYLVPPISLQSKQVTKTATLFVACTQRAKSHLQFLGVDPARIVLVYPGIDLSEFKPSVHQHLDQPVSFLFAGILEPHKGLETLVQAFRAIKNPRFELLIAGRGSLDDFVRSASMKDPRIKYCGWVDHSKMPSLLQKSDVFCYPSVDSKVGFWKYNEEQFGYSLAEAMSCGLPIVATECGAIPEVIGSGNLIVPQSSTASLTLALEKAGSDHELRDRIGRANRDRSEIMFDLPKQSSTLESRLLDLLAS